MTQLAAVKTTSSRHLPLMLYEANVNIDDPEKTSFNSFQIIDYVDYWDGTGSFQINKRVAVGDFTLSNYIETPRLNRIIDWRKQQRTQFFSITKEKAKRAYEILLNEAIEYWEYCREQKLSSEEKSLFMQKAFKKLRDEFNHKH